MGKVTITIDEATVGFIQAGFAFTRFMGKADVQERRQVASDDFDAAVRAAVRHDDEDS